MLSYLYYIQFIDKRQKYVICWNNTLTVHPAHQQVIWDSCVDCILR